MYQLIGGDQKEYGPVSADQVRQWISEGRANGQTLARFEDGPWKPLSTFPEFAPLVTQAGPPVLDVTPPYANAPRKTNGTAVAGFILSILGLPICCGPILATLGLIFSAVGLTQINQNPTAYTGKRLALAGIVIALADYVLFAILFFNGVYDDILRSLPKF